PTSTLPTLSLHDALPIYSSIKHLQRVADYGWDIAVLDPSRTYTSPTHDVAAIIQQLKQLKIQRDRPQYGYAWIATARQAIRELRSEEHTSELQSLRHLVC